MREETPCHHMAYSFRLATRILLYASSHRQDNTYHSLCYTSRGALDGTRNSSMGPPHEGSIRRPIAPSRSHVWNRGVNLYGLRVSHTDFCNPYDAILRDIYDFCRFKLKIIPRFIFKLFCLQLHQICFVNTKVNDL